MQVFDPIWILLSLVALVGGIMIILVPNTLIKVNQRLNKAIVNTDDLMMQYRHMVGALLLLVGFLCFRLALLMGPF